MKILKTDLSFPPSEILKSKFSTDTTMLFDIETTGLSARTSQVYLIGALICIDSRWQLIQWLSEKESDEPKILEAFAEFANNFTALIHYNGSTFDIPYLEQKFKQYNIEFRLRQLESFDLYKTAQKIKKIIATENLQLKTVEKYMGFKRKDTLSGKELIPIYLTYCVSHKQQYMDLILLHNADDLYGLYSLLDLYAYDNLIGGRFHSISAVITDTVNTEQITGPELIIQIQLSLSLPKAISFGNDIFSFSGKGSSGTLRIQLYKGTLKYFFPNYKEYYYLPDEDTAIHKSVAAYVDRKHRQQAKAATCYTKTDGTFVPQYRVIYEPYFLNEYGDKLYYFKYQPDIFQDNTKARSYLKHIFQYIIKVKT